MKHLPTFLAVLALFCGHVFAEPPAAEASALTFPGETVDEWRGFKRHKFQVEGRAAWVVEPKTALPGKPWAWYMEFPEAFLERCAAPQLLAAGFHYVHIGVGNTFGSPDAVKQCSAFVWVNFPPSSGATCKRLHKRSTSAPPWPNSVCWVCPFRPMSAAASKGRSKSCWSRKSWAAPWAMALLWPAP